MHYRHWTMNARSATPRSSESASTETGAEMKDGRRQEHQKEDTVQLELRKSDLAAFCKALGHPMRVEIIVQLRALERCVCGDLVARLPVAQATVSQHLKVLKQAGLVRGKRVGPRTLYLIDLENMDKFKSLTATL
jgi:DNA-binding transcriptional ArsR family regulator